jgi:hypothetical protein
MIIYTIFSKNSAPMSFNVPVVYDDLPARISETAGFAGLQKCGSTKHHKGRSSA